MRKLGIILGVVLVLVIAAVFALPYLIDVNRYHSQIQAEVGKRAGRPVTLGPMRLSIVPFAIHVQGATVGEDPSFGEGKIFAHADEVYVRADLLPLLRGNVQVRSLEMVRPQIELIRNAGGVWNFASVGENPQTAQPPAGVTPEEQQRAQQQKGAAPQQEFALDRLRITDGQIGVTDLQKRAPRAVYDHIDLAVENYRPGQPFDVDLAAHLPGQGTQTMRLTATVGPVDQKNSAATPIDGTLKVNEVSIGGVQRFLNSSALTDTDGIATGEAKLKSKDGKLESIGSLKLEQAKLRGVEMGYPIAIDYQLADDLNSSAIRIDKGTLKLGSTPVSITGTINSGPTPAQLDVRVWTPEAPIAEVARLASAFGVAFNPGMKIDGRIQADIQAKGAATQPLLNGRLSAKSLSMSGKDLKTPVQVQGVELTLSPEAIRSNQFAATTNGTTVTVQFAMTQYTTANPQLDAGVRTNGAQLADVLSIARAYGLSAAEGLSGGGRLALDLHASGPIKNASAMNLSGSGSLQDARLESASMATPVIVRNADLRFTQNSAVLQNFQGAIGSTNASGMVTLRNFAAPQAEFTLNADKLNLDELSSWFGSKRASAGLVPVAYAAEPSLFSKAVGHGKLSVGSVFYDQLVMNNAKADATLDRGVIRLQPVTSEVSGGTQTGSIVIDTRNDPVQYAVNTHMDKVDANKLLSSTTSLKQVLYGMLMANANTTFRSGGGSDQLARSLNGNLKLDLRNGKIANMDIWYQIASAGQFLTTGKQPAPFTNLLGLAGDFIVQNGVARTNNLRADIDGAIITGEGAASLVDQSLDMRVVAVLSKQRSQEVGGTGIGGLMTTALADQNGQLVIPVLVSGTFASPRFAPDLQRIAEMKMQQTFSNPLGAAGGILGGILGGGRNRQQQQQPGQQTQPQPPTQQQPGGTQQPQQNNQDIWQQILDRAQGKQQGQQPQPKPQPQQQSSPKEYNDAEPPK